MDVCINRMIEEPIGQPQTLEEFADDNSLSLRIDEMRFGEIRWQAFFPHLDIKECGAFGPEIVGVGSTPSAAVMDYAQKINGAKATILRRNPSFDYFEEWKTIIVNIRPWSGEIDMEGE